MKTSNQKSFLEDHKLLLTALSIILGMLTGAAAVITIITYTHLKGFTAILILTGIITVGLIVFGILRFRWEKHQHHTKAIILEVLLSFLPEQIGEQLNPISEEAQKIAGKNYHHFKRILKQDLHALLSSLFSRQ